MKNLFSFISKGSILLMAAVFVLLSGMLSSFANAATISFPAVSNLTSTGVTISYTVTDAILSNPSLCYGTTAQTVTTNCVGLPILDPGNPFTTKAVLSGLEPDISYYYQLILDKDVTPGL